MPIMQNPWLNVKPGDPIKMADGDDNTLVNFINNSIDKDLKDWPEPYMGDRNANVYLLNANPARNLDLNDGWEDPDYDTIMQNNLQHKPTADKHPFVFFNDIEVNTTVGKIPLGGCKWWQKRTAQLRKELELEPNFFVVEYFPYRTDNAKDIPDPQTLAKTKSYQYANQLIEDAMAAGKIIVIMRMKEKWLSRIPGLADYRKLYQLVNTRQAWITEGNISKISGTWEDLKAAL